MDRQTLRDWVHRFNAAGPDGLFDNWTMVRRRACRLTNWMSWPLSSRRVRTGKSTASCAGGGSISSASSPSDSASTITNRYVGKLSRSSAQVGDFFRAQKRALFAFDRGRPLCARPSRLCLRRLGPDRFGETRHRLAKVVLGEGKEVLGYGRQIVGQLGASS